MSHQSWKDVPTGSVDVGGTKFVYRQLAKSSKIRDVNFSRVAVNPS